MDTKTMRNEPPVQTEPPKRARPGESSVHLDQARVRGLSVPTREQGSRLVLDDEVPGFCCQVTYTGTRTFRLRYRKGGKWHSVKIGRWRDGKETNARADTLAETAKRGLTAGQARRIAAELRGQVDRGSNPAVEAKLRDAAQTKAAAGLVTVSDAFARYSDAIRSRRTPMKDSSFEKVRGSFENHILPRVGGRYISSVSGDDVRMLATSIETARTLRGRRVGGPRAANLAVAHLRAFLSWAVKQEIVAENVVKKVDLGDVLAAEVARRRYLTRDEWIAVMAELDEWPYWARRGAFGRGTKTVRLQEPAVRQLVSCEALRIALLTGARKGEVYRMRWVDVDLRAGWWRKPRETMKAGHEHEIALPEMAVASLRRLQAAHSDPIWVFPGKVRMDVLQQGRIPKANEGTHVLDVHELWGRIREKLGIPDVRIHDLRHTAASVLISSGATLHDVGSQLAHSQAQTTLRYAHLLEERKRALAGMMDSFATETLSNTRRKAG
ncbi:tyrosine-type recombinase/integrase [Lysobacter sp. HA35]